MFSKKIKTSIYISLIFTFFFLAGTLMTEASLNTDYVRMIVYSNQAPAAAISCDGSGCGTAGCTGYTGCNFTLVNDTTDPDGEADIVLSEWDIYGWGGTPDEDCAGKCNYTPQAIGPGNYTVELYVEDSGGAYSSTSQNFTMLQNTVANFQCGYTMVGPWLPCEGFGISEEEVIYFKDISTPSESGSVIERRDWYFEDGTPASNIGSNATTTYSTFALIDSYSGDVTLEAEDDANRIDATTYSLSIKRRSPQWREISP